MEPIGCGAPEIDPCELVQAPVAVACRHILKRGRRFGPGNFSLSRGHFADMLAVLSCLRGDRRHLTLVKLFLFQFSATAAAGQTSRDFSGFRLIAQDSVWYLCPE
jgi:hypothetical protein